MNQTKFYKAPIIEEHNKELDLVELIDTFDEGVNEDVEININWEDRDVVFSRQIEDFFDLKSEQEKSEWYH
jgi:hypothetical protein